ncbi:hypothetical protein PAXRUDRAFT_45037, partial [Paxillus rubicundulus Ve08.2h10]
SDWECVNDTCTIISNANNIQHLFSHERQPALWHAIPSFEELQTAWEEKHDLPKYSIYTEAIAGALMKIRKYYNKFDNKPIYALALVLHPYYKLTYIKMAWG